MSDKAAQRDALRAKRAFETYERDWRRKEKETVEKQIRQEKELRQERSKQKLAREEAITLESRKLNDLFIESIKQQKQVEQKIKDEEKLKNERNRAYALELQQQINKKEQDRKKDRSDFFLEGVRLAKERNEKKLKIDAIKNRKIQVFYG
jgi:hypothetical protein